MGYDDRTYGATKNCAGCKYWSEMLAQSIGGAPVEAMCLSSDGPMHGKYVTARATCKAWESGEDGAIDDPAGAIYSL
jgi:hypothetical protein